MVRHTVQAKLARLLFKAIVIRNTVNSVYMCIKQSIKQFALSLTYFATMYFYHYVYCIFIRICFIALCNIRMPMPENSSVELMFIFITRRLIKLLVSCILLVYETGL